MKKYRQAIPILEKIKSAKRILLCLHRDPDEDSVGSNLALFQALGKLGKTGVEVISPDGVPEHFSFLPCKEHVKEEDIVKKDVSGFDLFISLDSSAPHMLTRDIATPTFPADLEVVVIDHHVTNTKYGQINLVDDAVSSTSELLFNLFNQWGVQLNKDIATCLLCGIAGDTGTFRWATTKDTLSAAGVLLDYGADLSAINFNLYQRVPVEELKFAAKVFEKLQLDKAGRYTFAWAAMSAKEGEKSRQRQRGSSFSVVSLLASIEGTDFVLLIIEEESGLVTGSLRSRTGFDVSKIATALGGGGHKAAAGFSARGDFEKSVATILETVKRVVQPSS